MSEAEIRAGICGYVTRLKAIPSPDGQHVTLTVASDCPAVQKLAAN